MLRGTHRLEGNKPNGRLQQVKTKPEAKTYHNLAPCSKEHALKNYSFERIHPRLLRKKWYWVWYLSDDVSTIKV